MIRALVLVQTVGLGVDRRLDTVVDPLARIKSRQPSCDAVKASKNTSFVRHVRPGRTRRMAFRLKRSGVDPWRPWETIEATPTRLFVPLDMSRLVPSKRNKTSAASVYGIGHIVDPSESASPSASDRRRPIAGPRRSRCRQLLSTAKKTSCNALSRLCRSPSSDKKTFLLLAARP